MRIYMLKQYLALLLSLGISYYNLFAQDQPPTQGPMTPGVSYKAFKMSSVLDLLESEIQKSLDTIHLKIEKQKDSTGIQVRLAYSYKAFPPYKTTTNYKDQPNQYYIRMPLLISYEATEIKWKDTSYPTRKIHQFADVIITCKDWFTEAGAFNFKLEMQKPYADDRPSSLQALNFFMSNKLTTLLDKQLRTNLPAALNHTLDSTIRCNCLDVSPGIAQANHYKDSEIRYSYDSGIPLSVDSIEVDLISLKRLYAHTYPDFKILYKEEEDLQLIFYANQIQRTITLNKIKEEQERNLSSIEKIVLPKPAMKDLLMLIGNIKLKLPNVKKLTELNVFNKFSNFGNGIQRIVFYKSYVVQLPQLPSGEIPKPYEVKIPAYELKLEISDVKPETIMVRN